jgi:hypothetical protein
MKKRKADPLGRGRPTGSETLQGASPITPRPTKWQAPIWWYVLDKHPYRPDKPPGRRCEMGRFKALANAICRWESLDYPILLGPPPHEQYRVDLQPRDLPKPLRGFGIRYLNLTRIGKPDWFAYDFLDADKNLIFSLVDGVDEVMFR